MGQIEYARLKYLETSLAYVKTSKPSTIRVFPRKLGQTEQVLEERRRKIENCVRRCKEGRFYLLYPKFDQHRPNWLPLVFHILLKLELIRPQLLVEHEDGEE